VTDTWDVRRPFAETVVCRAAKAPRLAYCTPCTLPLLTLTDKLRITVIVNSTAIDGDNAVLSAVGLACNWRTVRREDGLRVAYSVNMHTDSAAVTLLLGIVELIGLQRWSDPIEETYLIRGEHRNMARYLKIKIREMCIIAQCCIYVHFVKRKPMYGIASYHIEHV